MAYILSICISILRVHWIGYIYALGRTIQVIPVHDIAANPGDVVINFHLG